MQFSNNVFVPCFHEFRIYNFFHHFIFFKTREIFSIGIKKGVCIYNYSLSQKRHFAAPFKEKKKIFAKKICTAYTAKSSNFKFADFPGQFNWPFFEELAIFEYIMYIKGFRNRPFLREIGQRSIINKADIRKWQNRHF